MVHMKVILQVLMLQAHSISPQPVVLKRRYATVEYGLQGSNWRNVKGQLYVRYTYWDYL